MGNGLQGVRAEVGRSVRRLSQAAEGQITKMEELRLW